MTRYFVCLITLFLCSSVYAHQTDVTTSSNRENIHRDNFQRLAIRAIQSEKSVELATNELWVLMREPINSVEVFIEFLTIFEKPFKAGTIASERRAIFYDNASSYLLKLLKKTGDVSHNVMANRFRATLISYLEDRHNNSAPDMGSIRLVRVVEQLSRSEDLSQAELEVLANMIFSAHSSFESHTGRELRAHVKNILRNQRHKPEALAMAKKLIVLIDGAQGASEKQQRELIREILSIFADSRGQTEVSSLVDLLKFIPRGSFLNHQKIVDLIFDGIKASPALYEPLTTPDKLIDLIFGEVSVNRAYTVLKVLDLLKKRTLTSEQIQRVSELLDFQDFANVRSAEYESLQNIERQNNEYILVAEKVESILSSPENLKKLNPRTIDYLVSKLQKFIALETKNYPMANRVLRVLEKSHADLSSHAEWLRKNVELEASLASERVNAAVIRAGIRNLLSRHSVFTTVVKAGERTKLSPFHLESQRSNCASILSSVRPAIAL